MLTEMPELLKRVISGEQKSAVRSGQEPAVLFFITSPMIDFDKHYD